MADEEEEKNVLTKVIDWFKEAAEWVQENLGDPSLAEVLREDLGLSEGGSVPAAQSGQLKNMADGLDPDVEAFAATVEEIVQVVQAMVQIGDTLGDDDLTGWDVAWLLSRVMISDSIRARWPVVYAIGKISEFVTDDPEQFEEFDPAILLDLFRGEPPEVTGEGVVQRWDTLTWLLLAIGEQTADAFGIEEFSAYSGWDPDPTSGTPEADLVSSRAATLMFGNVGDLSAGLAMTVLAVPPEHQGPGMLLSFGGALAAEQTIGPTTYKFRAGVTGGLDMFIPFSDAARDFEIGGAPNGFVGLDVIRSFPDKPALRIGDPGGTRLDVNKVVVGVDVSADRAAARMGFEEASLVIVLGDGDGFLAQLPGAEIKIDLALVIRADSETGFHVEGGTRARATLPVNNSLFGVFTVYHVEIGLGPSTSGRDVALELSGGFGLSLGPFRATVDRIGLLLDAEFAEGNLGFMDVDLGFKPPSGIGLLLEAGPVRGGGYLFIDPVRGEYGGALELKFGAIGLKAIGVLSTKMADGSDGWSLVLLVYGEFPAIQLGWGFVLSGLGGMIGIQHAVSIDALQNGLRTGVLDDILFPSDPVADAPRIINRLREVFPATPRALTFGPMVEIGWGTPKIITIRLGIIIQLDNAVGSGEGSLEFSKFVLVGQLKAQLPPEELGAPPLLKLLIDVLGYYDANEKRLGFIAQLRDSKVAGLTLTGTFIVQADFGEDARFVLAAGGFHPRFTDLPPGLPSKIARLGVKFDIKIVKITIEGYFAVTPATVQVGANVKAVAKIGPVRLEGWLGFDAIFYFEPRFHFEVDLRAGVAIKFKSFNLASVDLKMTLKGPGRWEATGKVKFSVLWWDISKSFDVATGSAPDTPAPAVEAAGLLRQALENRDNWSAQLPAGETVASIGKVVTDALLAHPLGQLQVVQNAVPIGLRLEKYGNSAVTGPDRFEIEEVRVGSQTLSSPRTVQQSFARSHFVEMSEEDKLTRPSFEKFTAGIAVGSDTYVPAAEQVAADLSYETHYLEPPRDRAIFGKLEYAGLLHEHTAGTELTWQAELGAAGVSTLRVKERLGKVDGAKVAVREVPLAAADTATMTAVGVDDGPDLLSNTAIAEQQIERQRAERSAAQSAIRVVEAFELEGAN